MYTYIHMTLSISIYPNMPGPSMFSLNLTKAWSSPGNGVNFWRSNVRSWRRAVVVLCNTVAQPGIEFQHEEFHACLAVCLCIYIYIFMLLIRIVIIVNTVCIIKIVIVPNVSNM